jgi:hypothetical protein
VLSVAASSLEAQTRRRLDRLRDRIAGISGRVSRSRRRVKKTAELLRGLDGLVEWKTIELGGRAQKLEHAVAELRLRRPGYLPWLFGVGTLLALSAGLALGAARPWRSSRGLGPSPRRDSP